MLANHDELRALMISGLDGEAAAYRTLLDGLSLSLRAYYKGKLVGAGRAVTEAEDLVQEALIAIHVHRHTYDRSVPLMPWVYAIARYKLIDHLRRTRSSMSNVPIDDAADISAHDDSVDTESTLDVDRLLEELPDKMQRSIRYVKLDGLSVAETASRTGMSESAVKVSIHRGLKALAALIARRKGS